MGKIGIFLEESLNLANRNSFEAAFLPVCEAVKQTADKIYRDKLPAEFYFQRFISDHWRQISFIAFPNTEEVPANLPFNVRRAVPSLNSPNLAQEIIIYSVRQTLLTRRLPLEIKFDKAGSMQIEDDKLIFPRNVLFALMGSVVFHQINKDETISPNYWLNVRGFQMFITELWGREDLLERIMSLYS